MTERIEVVVPVRVDLAGGWTDVQPYTGDYGGEVVNFAINKYIRSALEKDDEEEGNAGAAHPLPPSPHWTCAPASLSSEVARDGRAP